MQHNSTEVQVTSSDGHRISCCLRESTTPICTCLYVHGGAFANGDKDSAPDIVDFLSSQCHCTVLTCSFRNGPSYPASSGKAMQDLLAVSHYLRSLLPHLPFGIVGSSSGGYFGLALAKQLHPSFPVHFCVPICPVAHPGRRARYLQSCIAGTAQQDGYTFFHPPKIAALIHSTQLSYWEEDSVAEQAGEALLARLDIPTLCILGAEDTNVPPSVTAYVQQWATKTISIGGYGHEICTAPPLSTMDSYVEDVRRFIECAVQDVPETSHSNQRSTSTNAAVPSLPSGCSGCRLRAATSEDVASLRELEQSVVQAERPFDNTIHPTDATYYKIDKLIAENVSHLLVVEDRQSKRVLASGYVQVRTSKEYKIHALHGYLGFMFVDPILRGKGVNQVVVSALMEWAAEQHNVTHFYLDVYSLNHSAVRAYQKAGFVELLSQMTLCRESENVEDDDGRGKM